MLLLFAAGPVAGGEAEWKLLHDQALAQLKQAKLGEAELLARGALTEAESSFGVGHPAIEQSLSTLSTVLRLRGKPAEALPLAQRLVVLRAKRLSPNDPLIGIAVHNTAEIVIALNRFDEAEKLQRQALAIFEKAYGTKHLHTAAALHNLGAILLKQEKPKEAEKYLRRALAAKVQVLKPDHLSIAHTLDNLSTALEAQGRQIEAEKYKRRAEAIRRKAASS